VVAIAILLPMTELAVIVLAVTLEAITELAVIALTQASTIGWDKAAYTIG
jgi:hypothetical protein|tara:strand:- start:153 stop:302 length:150 start_codon:yes stop_codon:yes gene_type:complete